MPKLVNGTLESDWAFEVPVDRPVDWASEGRRFQSKLRDRLVEAGYGGQFRTKAEEGKASRSGRREALVLFTVGSPNLRSGLAVFVQRDGPARLFVAGDGERTRDKSRPWLRALLLALDDLDSDAPQVEWWAAIEGRAHNNIPFVVTGNLSVGPLVLEPSNRVFQERIRADTMPGLLQMPKAHLVIVWGKLRTHSSPSVPLPEANRTIRRLCGILTLCRLRDHWEPWGLPVPANTGFQLPSAGRVPGSGGDSPEVFEPPDWISTAWSVLDQHKFLAEAVDAYYEGSRLVRQHPSYALLAFTGAAEALGEELIDVEAPPVCESCKRPMGSSSFRKVERALGLVASSEEANALAQQAFPLRSKTAHSGRVHAAEQYLGLSSLYDSPGLTPASVQSEFAVFQMQRYLQLLLVKALACELPLGGG